MKESKIKDNKEIKMRAKEIILKAKKKNLIKPHVLAFKDNPVENEIHKGNINVFVK